MRKLVIVGNGMAGVGCVEQVLKHRHDFDITVFGDETHVNVGVRVGSIDRMGHKILDQQGARSNTTS